MACDIVDKTLSSCQNKKRSILPSTMELIIFCLPSSKCSLLGIMKVCSITLCFSEFLKNNEINNLEWQDILFTTSHMNLLLKK